MTQTQGPPQAVIESYALEPRSIERLSIGLINQTYSARRTDGTACILQRVSPIFPAEVNDDIEAVTAHLSGKGLATPRLLRSRGGTNHVDVDGAIWRLMTLIEGETVEIVASDAAAHEAGFVLGAFHRALADFDEPLLCRRPAVHDIERHLGTLRSALEEHADHAAHRAIKQLAEEIFALAVGLEPLPDSPLRMVHGDPKISNVIFREGRGVCLVDLDTVARMPVAIELGDAMRSWCNPGGEDSPDARCLIARFGASLEGYRQAAPGLLTEPEWRAVPNATLAITLELSARFAADALRESYFSWDRTRFGSASEHNETRATSQLNLAKDIARQLPAMHELVMTLT